MKMIRRIVDSAKVIIAFFIHLNIVISRETRRVTKITKRRRIYIVVVLS